jgi:hypothetical protein
MTLMFYGWGYYCKSFAVQEIADTLAGTDKSLIKPVNPEIWLYIVV